MFDFLKYKKVFWGDFYYCYYYYYFELGLKSVA